MSHGRNKYLLATVKTSSIAPSLYDPVHFITATPVLSFYPHLSLPPALSIRRSLDQTCIAAPR